ncbi:MAG: 3-oxoacyl-ACP reductase FabG [Chlamydiota bacterium]|jgi:3-oxoacyl-[acyl-carrier protein] reductase
MLKGKKAVITGGTSGIGKEIANVFAAQGADVIVFGTNAQRAQQIIQELKQLYPSQEFSYELLDVSKINEVEKALNNILEKWKSIDVLVNNAGITKDNLLVRMKEDEWDQVISVNLKSVYNTCRALARSMMKAKAGTIINITSVIGLTGNAGQVNYAASKSGMIGFTKSLAKELASRGVRVNCIAPGYIDTPMTNGLPEKVKESILHSIPMNRMGEPKEIANAALFLASDLSKYITGQVLTVDGGMVM